MTKEDKARFLLTHIDHVVPKRSNRTFKKFTKIDQIGGYSVEHIWKNPESFDFGAKPLHEITDEHAIQIAISCIKSELTMDAILSMSEPNGLAKHYDLKASVKREIYDPKREGKVEVDHWVIGIDFHGVDWYMSIYDDEIVFYKGSGSNQYTESCNESFGFDKACELGYLMAWNGYSCQELIKEEVARFK